MKNRWLIAPVMLAASLLLVACGGDEDEGAPPSVADGVREVVRQQLAAAHPETADGQLLELTRVIIPAGEGIEPHTHPGPQLAVIVSGTLTYTVIEGEATVIRAAATDSEEVETYTSGQQFELQVGDSLQELDGILHQAANETDEPVILYLSSLFPEGAPPATLVE